MAKLFYTVEEAAERLGMSEEEVRNLVSTGQLQEFRDGDRLMFKVEQVDVLAGGGEDAEGDDDEGFIPLAEDSGMGTGIGLASESGSGLGLEGEGRPQDEAEGDKEQTGVGFFEVEETEQADPSAVTQVAGDEGGGFDLGGMGGDAGASGSGLMDLTREADDTSLGADLLEGLSAGDESGETVGETVAEELFESTETDVDVGAAQPAMALAEPYDGPGSGLVGGLALATIVLLGFASLLVIGGLTSVGAQGPIVDTVGNNYYAVIGAMVGVVVVFALLGWVLGRRS